MSSDANLEVREVGPEQRDLFARWHATYVASTVHEVGRFHACWTLPELEVSMAEHHRRFSTGYVGLLDGEVAAAGFLSVPLLDNLDSAFVEVHTRPDMRRRGFGTAVLEAMVDVARGRGRTLLDAEAVFPHAAGTDGAGTPAVGFAGRHGFTLGLSELLSELALPVDDALLEALAAEAAPHHAAYTLRSWVGPVPDDLVASWLALSSTLNTEAPMGDIEVEAESTDVGAHRADEVVTARQGRLPYHTVALDAAGTVVACTDLVTTVHEADRAYQWATLVRPADRGHRLGLAVKVANLAQLQRERPDLARLTTFNAEVNEHMLAVNDRLGFRPVARLAAFQKRLG